jgi:hypothetical protein
MNIKSTEYVHVSISPFTKIYLFCVRTKNTLISGISLDSEPKR